MKIHEYQAKAIFKEYNIPTPSEIMVVNSEEAVQAAVDMGLPVVIKAQVHTGGRGKAGGVKLAHSIEDVRRVADEILALTIKEFRVRKLLIAPVVDIVSESYLSILIDRAVSKVVFIGCAQGGMEIEETATNTPELILRLEVNASQLGSLTSDDCMPLAAKLFADSKKAEQAAQIMVSLGRVFLERDCSLIEINPLVVDGGGNVIALDAKVLLDDNALFRQPRSIELADPDSMDLDEIAAKESNVTFVRLDGNVGCMVNGAGLAMGTMDIIKHFGGSPANFLDAGGSSDPKKVIAGLKLILKDPNVSSIFINIFGGITRCDDIAKGIVAAIDEFQPSVPIVIRLAGTNAAEGMAMIAGTGMRVANSLEQGAQWAVEMGGAR